MAEIELEILTPMFSYGHGHEKDPMPEFRITEVKSLMRTTFRELYYFKDLNDMRKKEEELFGSINKKSPVIFRIKSTNLEICKRNLVPHKEFREIKCIDAKSKINLIIGVKDIKNIEFYIILLIQASIIGSIGRRSRKGFGSFKINGINGCDIGKYMSSIKIDFKNVFGNTSSTCKEYRIRDITPNIKANYNELLFKEANSILDYPYIKKLIILEMKDDQEYDCLFFNISELTHIRLDDNGFIKNIEQNEKKINKSILGNCCKAQIRFASPVWTSFCEINNKKYAVIKILNYNYIFEKLNIEKKHNEVNYEYVEKYVEELIKYLGDEE